MRNFKGFKKAAQGRNISTFKEKNAHAFYTKNVGDEFTLHLSIGEDQNAFMQCRLVFDLETWNDLFHALKTKIVYSSVEDSVNVFLPKKADIHFTNKYTNIDGGKQIPKFESINESGVGADRIRLRMISLGYASGSSAPIGLLNVELFDDVDYAPKWKVYASTMLSL